MDDDKKKWEEDHQNGSHDSNGDGELLGMLISSWMLLSTKGAKFAGKELL